MGHVRNERRCAVRRIAVSVLVLCASAWSLGNGTIRLEGSLAVPGFDGTAVNGKADGLPAVAVFDCYRNRSNGADVLQNWGALWHKEAI